MDWVWSCSGKKSVVPHWRRPRAVHPGGELAEQTSLAVAVDQLALESLHGLYAARTRNHTQTTAAFVLGATNTRYHGRQSVSALMIS